MGKMGQAPSFCRDELFPPSTVLRDRENLNRASSTCCISYETKSPKRQQGSRSPKRFQLRPDQRSHTKFSASRSAQASVVSEV